MAKMTLAQAQAQIEALTARALDAERVNESLMRRLKHDFVERDEYNRVQRLLSTTQQFCEKYKRRAQGGCVASGDAPMSERRAAMERAKQEAIRTGQSVAVRL